MTTNQVRSDNLFNNKCKPIPAKDITKKSFFNATNITLSQTLYLWGFSQ